MKKMLALFLAAMLLLTFVACGTQKAEEPAAQTPAAEKPVDEKPAEEKPAEETPAEKQLSIGLTFLNLDNPFFVSFKEAIEAACAAEGVNLVFSDSQGTSEGQIKAMEDFIAMGVDAIIITPQDGEAILPYIQEARSQGIKVVCHTIMPAEFDAYVGADEHDMGFALGEAAGKWIKENLGDQEVVKAATLNYDIAPTVIARKEGIIDGVNSVVDNVEFVADALGGEVSVGMAAAEAFLAANPDLQVLLSINDAGALGAYEAFVDAGKTGDDILIGGIDATADGLAKVAEGGIYRITVDQDPVAMGQKCVEFCLRLIAGETLEDPVYWAKLVPVTIDNVSEYGY